MDVSEQQVAAYQPLLSYWFGRIEETIVPSENRAKIWFGENQAVDAEIKDKFMDIYQAAVNNELKMWQQTSRGQLALIILLDQFSRHIHRDTSEAFSCDKRALDICSGGVHDMSEHELSLIERVFYYLPLMHSECPDHQALSLQCYGMLVDLALPETKMVYEGFYRFAQHHYIAIKKFGRFPQRNQLLSRQSTDAELAYLEQEGKL